MKIRNFAIALLGFAMLTMTACGGGGGTATPAVVNLDSDVAKWTGTPCATGSTYTVLPDDVNVTLNAFPLPAGGSASGEAVLLQSVTISFTPANTSSPALPPLQQALLGQQVALGGSVTIPVRVAPQEMKLATPLSDLVCSSNIYVYYVTMTFHCRYLQADTTFDTSAQINVRFADFAN